MNFTKISFFRLDFYGAPCYNLIMKQSIEKKGTVFPVKLSKLLFILCIACLVLCATGIGVTVYRIVKVGIHGVLDVFKYPLLIAVCLLCILLVLSIMIRARYIVDDKTLTTQFGIIKSVYPLKDITAVTVDLQTNKLTVHQGENFFLLGIAPAWQNQFVLALTKDHPSIDVRYTLTENKPPKDEPKQDE